MISLTDIYTNIKNKFFAKTNLDIQEGTVIDSYVLATAEGLHEAYQEIENNKNPHLFTKLNGNDLDSLGYMMNCPRVANESDDSYKYRIMNWTHTNEASNQRAIETALMNLDYASFATYVPLTEGVGTATVYIIPKSYSGNVPDAAIAEVKRRLADVVSPSSYVSYAIPSTIPVRFVAYINSIDGDLNSIQANIKKKVSDYINAIAVGDYLELGEINKIGVNEPNVDYFNVVQMYLNGTPTDSLRAIQKVQSKLVFDDIIWWTVVSE